jgi:aminopeptidase N
VAEVDTLRHDWLTFSRSSAQAEDVSLFQRDERRTIALYSSVAKIAARGRFYSDDATREYDVIDYNVDIAVVPDRQFVEGRTRLVIRVRSTSISNVMLRLAETLAVRSVTSVEYGPLLHLRVRGQNAILVSLPRVATQDSELTLIVSYAGEVESQSLDVDTVTVLADPQEPAMLNPIEPHLLLSSRIVWYPQNPVSDYATGTVRVTVPPGYRALASGAPVPAASVVTLRDLLTLSGGTSFVFRADQPLRYLAVAVGRFVRVDERAVTVDAARPGTDIESVALAVETHPRLQARGRQVAAQSQSILAFFSSLLGEAPFTAMTIGLVEAETPGGHSPGYFALLNEPLPNPNVSWRGDPAAFDNFPEFFLAHELAHQWWGQAVGWKNYHEQWISEGFSQYFAALWAQRSRGDRVFTDMLRQFRRWSMSESDQGPVHLGYRLGHIKRDLRVYRALVYNKGALVLHMLRRLVGDDVFFRGLQRFYDDRRFQKAGTDDFERAMEEVSGRTLDRFFERWIYGTGVPRVTWRSTIEGSDVRLRFEQPADQVFDLPVTVTITGSDGRTHNVVVELSEAVVEHTIAVEGGARNVQLNRDNAALAEFDGR